jgi:nickel-type superoxide dismutase maturation protease
MARLRPYPWLLVGITAGVVAAVAALVRSTVRVEVSGESMVPTLLPGDRVVALGALAPRVGDVVAVADPRAPGRLLVKRVVAVGRDHSVEVAGDNPASSTDSRSFGPVAGRLVAGRVVWRYWPTERRGRLDRRGGRFARSGG